MAATNSISIPLARKSTLLSRLAGFCRKPTTGSRIPSIPAQIRELRSCSPCGYHVKPLSSSRIVGLKDFGRDGIASGQVGSVRFRVSAVSDGGAGGSGDGNSGGGGGGEGQGQGDGSEGGQNNWSLLSW